MILAFFFLIINSCRYAGTLDNNKFDYINVLYQDGHKDTICIYYRNNLQIAYTDNGSTKLIDMNGHAYAVSISAFSIIKKPFISVDLPDEWPEMSTDSTKPDTLLCYRKNDSIHTFKKE